jgi:hypothetical protein
MTWRIGLEQITCDDMASVRPIQQVAVVSLEQVTGNDSAPTQPLYFEGLEKSSNLNVAADFAEVRDGDEPILPTNHQDSMGDTEPTTDMQMSTTPSDAQYENATTNERNNFLHDEENRTEDLLIEAYLVKEDEEQTIYDATPELPWWRQRRTKILLLVLCIMLLLMAALLAFFLRATPPPPTASPTTSPTTSMSPSSSPHTSPKVSLVVVSNDVILLLHYGYGGYSRIFLIHYLSNLMPEFPDLLSEQEQA